jgi:hypothetical protein
MASKGPGNISEKSFPKQVIRLKLQQLRNLFHEKDSDRKHNLKKAATQKWIAASIFIACVIASLI